MKTVTPTNTEIFFHEPDLIVSKTDLKGRITYANQVFCRMAGYTDAELAGAPHSIIRHPDMPRAVFKLLWDTVLAGKEIFAYVKNMSRNGDFYWVFAHVTPSFDEQSHRLSLEPARAGPGRDREHDRAALYRNSPRGEETYQRTAGTGRRLQFAEQLPAIERHDL